MKYAFINAKIKAIKIPSSFKGIQKFAFKNCKNLESVEFIEDSMLELIGNGTFENSGIKSIKIPKIVEFNKESSLEYVGYEAFSNTHLRKIVLPKSLNEN